MQRLKCDMGMAAVELVVDAAPLVRSQVLAGEIWGDVNNDGQVVLEDAMLVAMYSSNPSIAMPNNGSVLLGDVNGDGQVNKTDALVIMRYVSNPLDGALPAGIGQRIASGKLAAGRHRCAQSNFSVLVSRRSAHRLFV